MTDAPETGFPKLSITVTWSGVANAVETVACCEFPPEIASAAAAPALITNEPLVAPVRPVLEAESVFVPIRFTERPGNVARPDAFVVWVAVPESAPVPDASASTIDTPACNTGLLPASSSCTVTAGVIACPAAVFVGCWTKASWVAETGAE